MKIPTYQGVRASSLSVSSHHLDVMLEDGRMLRIPTALFPKLKDAAPEKLSHWEWIGEGIGIEWPDLDEHLSIAGFLRNTPYFLPPKEIVTRATTRPVPVRPVAKRKVAA